ncbi:hypothetical protein JTB14_033329 [Gonioctena quinquepunctata]|nr:hypothetical protein JTB14_033329 [Gonioctena quinquepunctata]
MRRYDHSAKLQEEGDEEWRITSYQLGNPQKNMQPSTLESCITKIRKGASVGLLDLNIPLIGPDNTSAARSFRFNKKAVSDFYQNLGNIYGRYKFTANRIYNSDESGISTVLNTPKVLVDRSEKQIGQLVSAGKGDLSTFGGIISASRNTIPPLFVFPRVHFKDDFIEGSPEGSLGVATKSGWINSSIFIDVLENNKNSPNVQKKTLFNLHATTMKVTLP